jgi:hypothetical protein
MKNHNLQTDAFRELTEEEKYSLNGGGFAYDVGRLIRFIIKAGPYGQFTPAAIIDAAAAPYIE